MASLRPRGDAIDEPVVAVPGKVAVVEAESS
jgi:hypothetical protein